MPSSKKSTNGKQSYGAISKGNDDDDDDDEDDDPLLTSSSSSRSQMLSEQHVHSMLGIGLIMLGSFSFSVMFLLVKLLQGKANSFVLVFWRSLVQIVLSLTSIIHNKENPLGYAGGFNRVWLLVRGGFGAGAVIAWFYGIQNMALPDAVTLQFTTPVFAAIFAVCFAGEAWKRLDIVGAVVCLSGVCLIAHPTWLFGTVEMESDSDSDNDTTNNIMVNATMDGGETTNDNISDSDDDDSSNKGLAVAVTTAGAAMAGLAYVSVRLITNTSANVMVLYYATLSIPICLLGSYYLLDTWAVWGDVDSFTPLDYFLLLLTGLAGYGGQFFTNLGLQRETAATGTLATSTQIVWTYVFELLFLHEGINGWSLSGTLLILGFMVIVGISKLWESQAPLDKSIRSSSNQPSTAPLLPSTSDERSA